MKNDDKRPATIDPDFCKRMDRAAFYRRLVARVQSGELTEREAIQIIDEQFPQADV